MNGIQAKNGISKLIRILTIPLISRPPTQYRLIVVNCLELVEKGIGNKFKNQWWLG